MAPGNKASLARGFTMVELLVVLVLVGLASAMVSVAMRDSAASRLETDAARLAALLEAARAEARASGLAVRWVPSSADAQTHFQFVGLPKSLNLPVHWLDAQVVAQVPNASAVVLGPEPMVPAQRIILRLGAQRLDLATDGLGPFALVSPGEAP